MKRKIIFSGDFEKECLIDISLHKDRFLTFTYENGNSVYDLVKNEFDANQICIEECEEPSFQEEILPQPMIGWEREPYLFLLRRTSFMHL